MTLRAILTTTLLLAGKTAGAETPPVAAAPGAAALHTTPQPEPAVNENTANMVNTVNRYNAIGETNFARSPSM